MYCGYRIDGVPTPAASTPGADTPASDGKKRRKNKKKNKKNKQVTETPEAKVTEEAGKAPNTETTPAAKKESSAVKKFPNGLEVETLASGKPDGKKAASGKKVSAKK